MNEQLEKLAATVAVKRDWFRACQLRNVYGKTPAEMREIDMEFSRVTREFLEAEDAYTAALLAPAANGPTLPHHTD